MVSDAMQAEIEERAKEIQADHDHDAWRLAYKVALMEVALRETYIQFIKFRSHHEPSFDGRAEIETLLDACEDGELLAFTKGEYSDD